MNRLGVVTVVKNAFSVFFQNFATAFFIALICGGLGSVLVTLGGQAFADQSDMKGQSLLVVSQLFQILLATIWGGIVGSWAAPAQIYLWVAHVKGRTASIYDAVNYGLNRFSRVLPAHFKALAIVQAGNIVVVPGVLFGLQYAFVDAIATLDSQETSPLKRSSRLTSGRRGTIFRTMCVFLVWWLPYQFLLVYMAQSTNLLYSFGAGVIDHMVLILIDLCMVQFYLNLFQKQPEVSEGQSASVEPAAG